MNWERSLDIILAICIASLIYFITLLFEAIETTALRGTEAPRRLPAQTSDFKSEKAPVSD